MAYYDIWSPNPSENNQAPPSGGGEGKLSFNLISDTLRVIMASIAQLRDIVNSLGGISGQNANAVNITGGTIGPLVKMSAASMVAGTFVLDRFPQYLYGKFCDGLTNAALQTLYNLINPVGRIKLWHTADGSGLQWPGTTSTWIFVPASGDRLIVSSGSLTAVATGQGTRSIVEVQVSSTETANHTHSLGGNTGGHALTSGEVPALTSSGNGAPVGGGSLTNPSYAYGGAGAVHDHTLPAATGGITSGHAHSVTIDQLRFAFALVVRTA